MHLKRKLWIIYLALKSIDGMQTWLFRTIDILILDRFLSKSSLPLLFNCLLKAILILDELKIILSFL